MHFHQRVRNRVLWLDRRHDADTKLTATERQTGHGITLCVGGSKPERYHIEMPFAAAFRPLFDFFQPVLF
jgi:hypothetical protein